MTWNRDTSAKGTTTLVPSGKSHGPVLYIFPGIDNFPYPDGSKTGASWMLKQIPDGMEKFGAIVVARKSSAPWTEVHADAMVSMNKLGYSPRDAYAMGFSGGASILLGDALATAGWRRVMLVDPSIPQSVQSAMRTGAKVPGLDSRVEMRFNRRNWGGQYEAIKAAMPPLANAVNAAGGQAEETTDYHAKFVTDGFKAMLTNTAMPSLFGTAARGAGSSVSTFSGGTFAVAVAMAAGLYFAKRKGWLNRIFRRRIGG